MATNTKNPKKSTKTLPKKTTRRIQKRARSKLLGREVPFESDGTYLLKLVVLVLCGTLWLKFHQPVTVLGLPFAGFPLGLLIGLLLVHQFEKHQSDRKIWYACLLIVTIVCYFVPAGIVI